jgi:hypothetical protein
MKNETIIKKVFKDFGEDFENLTGSQILAIEESMLLARQDKASRVIKEIEYRTNKIGCFGANEERTKKIILNYGL